MGKEATNSKNPPALRKGAFLAVAALVKRHALTLAAQSTLPMAISVIIKCLDPIEPAVRSLLLNSAIAALVTLVQYYPNVALHHGTQRVAVGTSAVNGKSALIVYDLKSAQTHRTFDVHGAEITAVAFSQHGGMIAAYAHAETPPNVRVYSCGDNAGGISANAFLRGLLSTNAEASKHVVRVFTLPNIAPPNPSNAYYAGQHSSRSQWIDNDSPPVWKQPRPNSPTNSQTNDNSRNAADNRFDGAIASNHSTETNGASKRSALRVEVESDSHESDRERLTAARCVLKSILSVSLEWTDDNTFTLIRESGVKSTHKLSDPNPR